MNVFNQKIYWQKGIAVLAIISLVVLIFSSALPLRAEEPPAEDSENTNSLTSSTSSSSTSSSDIATSTESTASTQDTATTQSSEPILTSENSSTGASSANITTTENNNQADVTNENYATTTNLSQLKAITGKNIANYNTGSGIVTSEKAKGQGEIVNVINKNVVQTDPNTPGGSLSAGNENTGAGSLNEALTNLNNQLTVKNINNANTINKVEAEVSSGENLANYNTGHGIVLSGEASLGLNFISLANTNLTGSQKFYASWQNIFENWSGNVDLSQEAAADLSPLSSMLIDASNKSTGAGSQNQAIVNVNDQVSVTNQNSGKLNNEVSAKVVSGRNQANQNTGTGSIASGNVNSAVNAVSFLNSNVSASNWWLKNLNVFGNWSGNILLPQMPKPNLNIQIPQVAETSNSQTGYNSTNNASTTVQNSLDVQNNNEAVITNNVNLKAITGENKTSYNGGSGIVKYGEAQAEANELNVANLNVTGDSWWLVVVNTFGNWVGTTVGSPSDMIVSGQGNAKVLSPTASGIEVTNNSTGPNSNNSAGVNINHSTDISNSNNADILNTINIEAVSGENEAQFNTGHGYVDTGNIRTSNNLVNFANANIAVGNWMVVVVNVFGNWAGNLVFNTPDNNVSAQGSAGGSLDGSSSSTNQNTGANSTNEASSSTTNNTGITNTNTADVGNTASGTSSSGDNSASYNTGSGVVTTGQANTNIGIGNQVNTNTTNINGSGDVSSGSAANQNTGANSTNNSDSTNTTNTNVDNTNDVSATNNISGTNSTGQNSANYNTGSGVVDTGWVNTYVGLYNQYNDNQITIGQVAQDLNNSSTSSSGSGENSNVSNNNSATTDTNVNAENSTGQNSANYNLGITDNSNSNNNSNSQNTANSTDNSTSNNNSNSSSNNNSSNQNNSSVQSQSNNNVALTGGGTGGLGLAGLPLGKTSAKSSLKGDLNNDGKINDYDFSILMANWGKKFKDTRADANGDGKVDDYDFSIVMSNWNRALAVLE